MNPCYLPNQSTIQELTRDFDDEISKVLFFHERVKNQITILLGQTYVLSDVLDTFKIFSATLSSLINPGIDFGKDQIKVKDLGDKYDVYDHYFEVTRVRDMTQGQFIQQYLDTSAELINEIQYTSMSRGEIAYILKAWEAANLIILNGENPEVINFPLAKIVEVAPQDNDERAIYRWKVAHHGFALFMIFSGFCFKKATDLISTNGDQNEITDWLDKGAHLFRATTSCMEFGNSFTAQVYTNVVRADMSKANEEANLPNGFSGTQNFEYIQWRKHKMNLFATVKEHKNNLSSEVMNKLELFRCYYLEDMHIHSIIAGRMVGIEKSLLQEGIKKKFAITAADMLRMMAMKRHEEVQFILDA